MTDLADFLLARIAEDERDAQAAIAWTSPWRWLTAHNGVLEGVGFIGDGPDVHIVRWSPRRVLRECEAKRRIVERHRRCDDVSYGDTSTCPELQDLALPYADHPDYRPEWRP